MKTTHSLFSIFILALLFYACDPSTANDETTTDGTENTTNSGDENTTSDSTVNNTESGTFQLYMNDSLVREGTVDKVGLTEGISRQYSNVVSMDKGTIINMIISGFSYTNGNVVALNDGSDDEAIVYINGWDILDKDKEETYFSISGSVTRTNSKLISFEGKCLEVYNTTDTISFKGYYESEAFEAIK